MKVQLHSFLILELNGIEGSAFQAPVVLSPETLLWLLKAIPLQAWTGRDDSWCFRLPDLMTVST